MRYLSVCSGIEAATVAWRPLGWTPAAFSEIEAFPRAVLKHHYPDVPCHGDFTTIGADEYGPVDLLVGGTPCQSFSVAGLRGGLADERGNLALEYLRLADRVRPRWLVWENVPGVLSSEGGRDFGTFLGGLAELGYGFAFRVLDAQHFGVPQRRRRVFVVGHSGSWRSAAAVLFERHSLQGNPPPIRKAGQGTPGRTARSLAIRGRDGTPQAELGDDKANAILTPNGGRAGVGCGAVHIATHEVAGTMMSYAKSGGDSNRIDNAAGGYMAITHSLRAEGFDASEDGTGRGTPLVPVCREVASSLTSNYGKQPDNSDTALGPNLVCFTAKDHGADASDISPTLCSGSHSGSHANGGVMPAVAFNITPSNSNKDYNARQSERAQALTAGGNRPSARGGDLIAGSAVRRLTPRECERLQGFPDDYTLVPYRGKPAADGPRYKSLGNSFPVPVIRWIGGRIKLVDAIADTHPKGEDVEQASSLMSGGGSRSEIAQKDAA